MRLATTSYDGFIRLYEVPTLRLMAKAKKKSPGGNQPFGVRFSPDGSRLAVGFVDSPRGDVLSARDLSRLYAPDTSNANTNLGSVEWSKDGEFLYAAGRNGSAGNLPILRWADGGGGKSVELPGANSTIMYLAALRGGGRALGSADPAAGVVDRAGKRVFFNPPPVADYRGLQAGFRMSRDGLAFSFA